MLPQQQTFEEKKKDRNKYQTTIKQSKPEKKKTNFLSKRDKISKLKRLSSVDPLEISILEADGLKFREKN